MNRTEFRNLLSSLDLSERLDEEPYRRRMLDLIDNCPTCFERDAFPAHFTGSAFVVAADGAQCLLHRHRKLDRWLQFGGHCDGEADTLAVARREAFEESGITGLIVASTRPFDLDIHVIPANGCEPDHLHYDVRYVFIAPEKTEICLGPEKTELRWFFPEEMKYWNADLGLQRMARKWEALLRRRSHH